MKAVEKERGDKGKKVLMGIGVGVRGEREGGEVGEGIEVMGRETGVRRLKRI